MRDIAPELTERLNEAERNWAEQAEARRQAAAVPFADKVASVRFTMKNAAPGSQYKAVKGPQVSHSLPLMPDSGYVVRSEGGTKIREYADGTRADTRGRRIMETQADVARAQKAGFTREKD